MSTCQATTGLILTRPCKNPSTSHCSSCDLPICPSHNRIVSDLPHCPKCVLLAFGDEGHDHSHYYRDHYHHEVYAEDWIPSDEDLSADAVDFSEEDIAAFDQVHEKDDQDGLGNSYDS